MCVYKKNIHDSLWFRNSCCYHYTEADSHSSLWLNITTPIWRLAMLPFTFPQLRRAWCVQRHHKGIPVPSLGSNCQFHFLVLFFSLKSSAHYGQMERQNWVAPMSGWDGGRCGFKGQHKIRGWNVENEWNVVISECKFYKEDWEGSTRCSITQQVNENIEPNKPVMPNETGRLLHRIILGFKSNLVLGTYYSQLSWTKCPGWSWGREWKKIAASKGEHLVANGSFNYPHIDWVNILVTTKGWHF